MRRIIHLSDLHFGADEPAIAEGLLRDIERQSAHMLVVSGDLTQRARSSQFADAERFLKHIALPQIVVPGNHDIPLFNAIARWLTPLDNYRRFINRELEPTFADAELAVAGINTARSNTWKDGRISPHQVERLRQYFTAQPDAACKILVAHHPFIPPAKDLSAALVDGGPAALRILEACGCHLILAGHLHLAYSGDVRPHHIEVKRSILVIQAGTAISHRRRDEANAYNVLTIDGPTLSLEVRTWNGHEFIGATPKCFTQTEEGWIAQ
ncbi:MAG: 3',5'-cyclic-nucleotide phosphodiesterase [Pirellula sp.]|nr:3',5'-cyclic-nucleotide phosphodiesterase [Pirellula sp.]